MNFHDQLESLRTKSPTVDPCTLKNRTRTNEAGLTLIQLIITVAVIAIVTTMTALGITRARGSLRLSNSTRQFAAYVERARADAVRRHDQATIQILTNSTYSVTMDFGGDGILTTQTFALESNVTFITPMQTISFDWRGRVPVEISVGFSNETGTANVNITGSGDVTIDSEIFHDASVPHIPYNANVSGDAVVEPAATPVAVTSTPDPSPATSPTSSPTPPAAATSTSASTPSQDPTPTPTATPEATPTPTPTPEAAPTPTPSSTPSPCSLTASPNPLTVVQNGSGTISVALSNSSGTQTISASSSNSGQIQVSPESLTVTGATSASFTVTVKKRSGSVTFTTACGSQVVTVTVP